MVSNPLIVQDTGLRMLILVPSQIDAYGKPFPSESDVKPWLLGGKRPSEIDVYGPGQTAPVSKNQGVRGSSSRIVCARVDR